MTAISIFVVAGLITCGLRCSMVLLGTRHGGSAVGESAIGLVTPAVLAAIVASALLLDEGEIARPDAIAVVSVAAAVGAVRRTSQIGLALAAGLPTYWIGNLLADFAGFG